MNQREVVEFISQKIGTCDAGEIAAYAEQIGVNELVAQIHREKEVRMDDVTNESQHLTYYEALAKIKDDFSCECESDFEGTIEKTCPHCLAKQALMESK